ncbi:MULTISPECIES: XRE family transcriptional regulator [Actinokineospora]|uniref:Uncharacterized protein n=1 Tax=Actinokineospora fastidiosa TaxID=1816 RepID=A0A918G9Q7_9PSEU|nr:MULTISPECIES: XRE family transcriptional regulator [Actinokineospora]UVS81633.1 hypothetical protein Actkin_05395 [Actinokineospora sp. UTMC 2448]GGS26316.1 hypothetical protein GCM10010171_19740 [Actinokineospora fastidiosa]
MGAESDPSTPLDRRRWARTAAGLPTIGASGPDQAAPDDVLSQVDTTWDERLTRLSQHDRVAVGPSLSAVSRQVLRAEADGPDRWVLIIQSGDPDRAAPQVRPLRNCVLGRVAEDASAGLVVVELLFDRPLARGETVITEHELVNVPVLDGTYERKFRLPVREFVLEVGFDPEHPPEFCEQYTRDDRGIEDSRPVALDRGCSVHGVALNFGPGSYGFRWGAAN